jgi:hypothetical protein
MASYKIVSREDFASLTWRAAGSYEFAASDCFCPLVLQEISAACLQMPLAFFQRDGVFLPVAVQSLQPSSNLFVSAEGRWSGGYVPSAYRSHPFRLVRQESSNLVLAVDMDSGLVEPGGAGFPFFAEDGMVAARLQELVNFLSHVEADRARTTQACMALTDLNLLEPWAVTLMLDDVEQRVEGYFKISEEALNEVDQHGLQRLRDTGALKLAYLQLLSMQHLPALIVVTQKRDAARRALSASDPSGMTHGILSFDNL